MDKSVQKNNQWSTIYYRYPYLDMYVTVDNRNISVIISANILCRLFSCLRNKSSELLFVGVLC